MMSNVILMLSKRDLNISHVYMMFLKALLKCSIFFNNVFVHFTTLENGNETVLKLRAKKNLNWNLNFVK